MAPNQRKKALMKLEASHVLIFSLRKNCIITSDLMKIWSKDWRKWLIAKLIVSKYNHAIIVIEVQPPFFSMKVFLNKKMLLYKATYLFKNTSAVGTHFQLIGHTIFRNVCALSTSQFDYCQPWIKGKCFFSVMMWVSVINWKILIFFMGMQFINQSILCIHPSFSGFKRGEEGNTHIQIREASWRICFFKRQVSCVHKLPEKAHKLYLSKE